MEPEPGTSDPALPRRLGLAAAVFAVCLLVRWLFGRAGVDGDWASGAGYRGDTQVWLRQVLAERAGALFEAGVPLRPPGMPWLVDRLWDGTPEGVATLKAWWRALGAAAPALLFLCLARTFAVRVALLASALFGLSAASLHLSHSINVETPYLALLLASMLALPSGGAWSPGRGLLFGALSAAACLFRAEHLVLAAGLGLWAALRRGYRAPLAAGAAALAFLGALTPAHLALWEDVRRFNAGEHPTPPATEAAFQHYERLTGNVTWTDDARAELETLPPFSRRASSLFVAATVKQRGGDQVTAADLSILDQAFGARPTPLAPRPFVSSSGPFNLFLASGPGATARFGLAPLQVPPPLEGGAQLYPPGLIAGLPPARLSLDYIPHLDAFNRGGDRALAHIASAPGDWIALVGAKLAHAWRGASTGIGGYALPLGPSGTRRPVDLVTDEGTLGNAWSVVLLGLAGAGLVLARRGGLAPGALTPWLLLLVLRFGLAAVFYGYARQGALALPAVALLVACALDRLVAERLGKHAARVGFALLAVLVAAEAVRSFRGVTLVYNNLEITTPVPPPLEEVQEVRLDYR